MGLDKYLATQDLRRIPEADLLIFAYIGGAFGAKIGQWQYRHKTRKQPFARRLNSAVWASIIVWIALLYPPIRGWISVIIVNSAKSFIA